jgi:cation:H+ antiporter
MDSIPYIPPLLAALGSVVIGIVLLARGGDWTIDSAAYIGEKLGMPQMLIGFTIVGFGTSLPELFVSVLANLGGAPDLALGNVMGSNVANILLIIGAAAVVAPVISERKKLLRDMVAMLLATAALAALVPTGRIASWQGWLMAAALAAYVVWQYRSSRAGEEVTSGGEAVPHHKFGGMGKAALWLVIGFASVLLGAKLLVTGASWIASSLGVPEAVIGLTLVAVGTSLPELVTCLAAAKKGHSDIVVGNIVGSNVFNILCILGVTAGLKSMPIAPEFGGINLAVLVAVSAGFAAWMLWRQRMSRPAGLALLGLYAGYIAWQYLG